MNEFQLYALLLAANERIRILPDGRAIRLTPRMFNTLLTISEDENAPCYLDGY